MDFSATARPDAFRPDLGESLTNLSMRLGEPGPREDALAAIEEAVTIHRELAAGWPDVYHQSWNTRWRSSPGFEAGRKPQRGIPTGHK
jgi:hypothetical protein